MAAPAMYYAIGDCHSYRFDGLIVGDPGAPVIVKARWQPFVRASSFTKDGWFDESTARIFVEQRFVTRVDEPVRPFPPLRMQISYAQYELWHYGLRPGCEDAVLLFSYGYSDVYDLMKEYGGRTHVECDGEDVPLSDIPDDEVGTVERVSYADVAARVRTLYEPYFSGLRALSDAGFRNIFVHDIPPPTSAAMPGLPYPRLQYKLCVIGNRLLAEFCSASGIELISTWDDVTVDGLCDPRFRANGVHLNPASARISLRKLHERVTLRA